MTQTVVVKCPILGILDITWDSSHYRPYTYWLGDVKHGDMTNDPWQTCQKTLLGCAPLEPLTSKEVNISTNKPKLTQVRPREDPQAMPFQKVKQWSTQNNNEIEWNIGIVGGFNKPTMVWNVFYNCYCY